MAAFLPNDQLEKYLRSTFDSVEIYDDRKMCLDYIASTDQARVTIYLIVESDDHTLGLETVRAVYCINSYNSINRLILRIRHDVRSDTASPIRPIEKSAHRISDKYAPFVFLMSHLELYVALYRDIHDRTKMKEEMLNACRLAYQS